MPSLSHVLVAGVASCAMAAGAVPAVAGAQAPATGAAPGAPGAVEQALPADKSGFGTSTTRTSKVWFTVQKEGGLGELFAPTIDAPSARALDFVVVDRRGHAVRASDADRVTTTLIDHRSLTYRQTFTERRNWRLTATYVTDPARRPSSSTCASSW
jgi:glucoamylase